VEERLQSLVMQTKGMGCSATRFEALEGQGGCHARKNQRGGVSGFCTETEEKVGAGYGRRMAKEGGSRLVGCAAGERWQRPCGGRGRHAGVGWGSGSVGQLLGQLLWVSPM
jgi:hypothetical protein